MSASAGTTLIAGVATLLLSLGVGVLIGQKNAPTPVNTKPTVITVQGGGSGVAAASAGSGLTAQSSASGSTTTAHHAKGAKGAKSSHRTVTVPAKTTPAAVTKAASNAAAKAVGGGSVGNPNSTVGSACAAGTPGCENGKLTNNLFGP